jgi:hypothetical protein
MIIIIIWIQKLFFQVLKLLLQIWKFIFAFWKLLFKYQILHLNDFFIFEFKNYSFKF